MISLFTKQKESPVPLLTLPTYCIPVPAEASNDLTAKREAQLQWMREKGMKYLGDPLGEAEKRPQRRPALTTMRLVSVRKVDQAEAELSAENVREA